MKMKCRWIFLALIVIFCIGSCSKESTRKEKKQEYVKEDSMELIKEALKIDEKQARKIVLALEEIGLNNIETAEKKEGTDRWLLVTDSQGKEMEVQIDKKFHVFAVKDIQADNYIYAEYE